MKVQARGDLSQRGEPLRKVVAGLKFLAVDGCERDNETVVDFGDQAVLASDGTHGTKTRMVLQRAQPGEFGADLGLGVVALAMQAKDKWTGPPGLILGSVEKGEGRVRRQAI